MENGDTAIPNWFFFLEAIFYFSYRMLDEMDGKQSRRIGASSPLGLLFDHGCDAFVMGFQTMVCFKCLQLGYNTVSIITFMLTISSFHFSTLEEYYIGGLFLRPGNGVSDGSLLIYSIFIYFGIYGNDWVLSPIFGEGSI